MNGKRVSALLAAIVVVVAAPPATAAGHRPHRGDARLYWTRAVDTDFSRAEVVVRRLPGGPVVALSHPPQGGVDLDPQVSPNGHWVVFERDLPDGSSTAWIVGADGGHEHALPIPCSGSCDAVLTPTWGRDGRHVYFTRIFGPYDQPHESARSAVLWSATLDGRHLTRVSPRGIDGAFEDYHASFAPSGYTVFVRVDNVHGTSAAFRMSRRGTHVRRLTPWSLRADTLMVSPARRGPTRNLVVFEVYGHGGPPAGSVQSVATVSATHPVDRSGRPRIHYLTSRTSAPVENFNPAWSPDGRRIAFVRFTPHGDSASGDIWRMRFNGTGKHQVSYSPLFEFRPAWGRAPR